MAPPTPAPHIPPSPLLAPLRDPVRVFRLPLPPRTGNPGVDPRRVLCAAVFSPPSSASLASLASPDPVAANRSAGPDRRQPMRGAASPGHGQ